MGNWWNRWRRQTALPWSVSERFTTVGQSRTYNLPRGVRTIGMQVVGLPNIPTAWLISIDATLNGTHFQPILVYDSAQTRLHGSIVVATPVVAVAVRIHVQLLTLAPATELLVTLGGTA